MGVVSGMIYDTSWCELLRGGGGTDVIKHRVLIDTTERMGDYVRIGLMHEKYPGGEYEVSGEMVPRSRFEELIRMIVSGTATDDPESDKPDNAEEPSE